MAARVAFSQSPSPTQVYIAVQKPSKEAEGAAETIKEANEIVKDKIGAAGNVTGCTITFNENARRLYIVLEGPISGINNTELVEELTARGYTVSIDGEVITGLEDLSKLPIFAEIAAMEKGSPDINLVVSVGREGALPVSYGVTRSATRHQEKGDGPPRPPSSEVTLPSTPPTRSWRPRPPRLPGPWI